MPSLQDTELKGWSVSLLLCAVSAGAERHGVVVFFSDTVITFAFVSLPGFRLKFALSHSIVILLLVAAALCLLMALERSSCCSGWINISRKYITLCYDFFRLKFIFPVRA